MVEGKLQPELGGGGVHRSQDQEYPEPSHHRGLPADGIPSGTAFLLTRPGEQSKTRLDVCAMRGARSSMTTAGSSRPREVSAWALLLVRWASPRAKPAKLAE